MKRSIRALAALLAAAPFVAPTLAPPSNTAIAPFATAAGPIQFQDDFGYLWDMTIERSSSSMVWLAGTVMLSASDVRTAHCMALSNGNVTFTGDGGVGGVPFSYNLTYDGARGQGMWVNVSGAGGS